MTFRYSLNFSDIILNLFSFVMKQFKHSGQPLFHQTETETKQFSVYVTWKEAKKVDDVLFSAICN